MTSAMHALRAHVKGGRLVLDEPADLPEGAEVEIAVLGDDLSTRERAELHASLDRALGDSEAGLGTNAGAYLARGARGVVDEVDEPVVLSPEENAKRWAEWVANGPQGPIEIEGDDGFPDEG